VESLRLNSKNRLLLSNAVVASLWGYYAVQSYLQLPPALFTNSSGIFLLTLFIRNSSLTLMFLIRRPAHYSSTALWEWLIALYGTFIGYLYVFQGPNPFLPLPFIMTASVLKLFISVLMIGAIFSLGRSFGIVPADRGIKTGGLYRFVRHPIYSLYLISDLLDMIGGKFVWMNAVVFVSFILATYLRTVYEERLLSLNPEYKKYMKKTPYRLFPGIF